jgi:hypothetical protein
LNQPNHSFQAYAVSVPRQRKWDSLRPEVKLHI